MSTGHSVKIEIMKKQIFLTLITIFFLLLKLNAQNYSWNWYQTIGSQEDETIYYERQVAIDNNNNIYYTGTVEDTAYTDGAQIPYNGSQSTFLIKYNENGDYIWSRTIGALNSDESSCISIDSENNIYITGTFYLYANFDGVQLESGDGCGQPYIIKYDENGNYL